MRFEATTTKNCTLSKKIGKDILMKPRVARPSNVQKKVTASDGNNNVHNPTDAVPQTNKLIEATEANDIRKRETAHVREEDYINPTPRMERDTQDPLASEQGNISYEVEPTVHTPKKGTLPGER